MPKPIDEQTAALQARLRQLFSEELQVAQDALLEQGADLWDAHKSASVILSDIITEAGQYAVSSAGWEASKNITPEEVAQRTGVESYERYKVRTLSGGKSGRTYQMLLEVVAALSREEKVCIVGHSILYASQLAQRVREMCTTLSIPHEGEGRVQFATPPKLKKHGTDMKVFVDHYVEEEEQHVAVHNQG